MESVWVDLRQQLKGTDVSVYFQGAGVLHCYLVPSWQVGSFVAGEVEGLRFDVSPPGYEVQVPSDGPWHLVMQGDGEVEVVVRPLDHRQQWSGSARSTAGPVQLGDVAALSAPAGSPDGPVLPIEFQSGDVPEDVPDPGTPETEPPAVPPPPPANPIIDGPAGRPVREQARYDLVTAFPNAGSRFEHGGDPSTYPTKVGNHPNTQAITNLLPAQHRAIPTGTMTGPNGTKYQFVSTPDGKGQGVAKYVTNGSVYDVTNPSNPKKVGDLPQIYQGSGFVTTENNQTKVVIIGNSGNRDTDETRWIWTAPYDPKSPNSWINNLTQTGDVSGLPGNRESQAVPLLGGGFLFVGTGNGGIFGVASGTVDELENARAEQLVGNVDLRGSGGPDLRTVYGPSVVDQVLSPDKTVETITMRVSTWPAAAVYQSAVDAPGATSDSIAAAVKAAYPDWKPAFPEEKFPYDPMTYLTTFTVTHLKQ